MATNNTDSSVRTGGSYAGSHIDSLNAAICKLLNRYEIHKGQTSTRPADAQLDGDIRITDGRGEIEPPFAFETLAKIVETSSPLPPNIEAMVTNVDGFGHMLEPVVNFNNPDVNDQVRDILLRQRLDDLSEFSDLMSGDAAAAIARLDPSIEEIEATKKLWKRVASVERSRAESFFGFINPLIPFVDLRRKTRRELEIFGNAAWEIIREKPEDVMSRISQVHFVPFVGVRLIQTSSKPHESSVLVKKDTVSFEEVVVCRYFRSFVRKTGNTKTYYKEFGDPRVMSRITGEFYETVDDLQREEPQEDGSIPIANEMHHWKIDSPLTPYGVPRWISSLISVLGSRASEEVNYLYFDNKAIPPMIMMVSGGRLTESSVAKIESYIEERVKGTENFHNIMVIEAAPASANMLQDDVKHDGKMKIELRPLVNDSIKDGLFQDYDANNQLKIGRSFRQSPIITGDTRDVNRSTAKVAKSMAEEQVYQPARDSFDAWIDRNFLSNLKIHFWKFKTNASVQRTPTELVDNVAKALKTGAITPNEARRILSDAFSVNLDYRSEQWAETPPALSTAAARDGASISGNPNQSLRTGSKNDGKIRIQDKLPEFLAIHEAGGGDGC